MSAALMMSKHSFSFLKRHYVISHKGDTLRLSLIQSTLILKLV